MSVKGQNDSGLSSSTSGSGSGLTRGGSFVVHAKSNSLAAGCKAILQDQSARLSQKHSAELELIDDLRTFFKAKCSIEKDYCTALSKLCTNHLQRKYPTFEVEKDSEIRSIYSAWQSYLEEEDKLSKFRATQFEQISHVYDTLKHVKSHKSHIGKKGIDNYLKKQHEELVSSASEIDKNRKLYFDEEHLAKQARDKEEKVKKRKGGIFSKFTHSESKKEKIGAHREASDIQSTMARNEYILSLVSGNAHFDHYFNIDLPHLMQFLEDNVLDKCKEFMINLLNSETSSLMNAGETLSSITRTLEATSADLTDKAFLAEQSSACLRDTLQFEFEPCDGDQVRTVSTEHNAELALQHEIAKWMSCFTKECRNLHRLNQHLTKCLNYQAAGKKNVEVTGVGVVEVETRIDDIRQQLRKCDISKCRAEARLKAIKLSGMQIDDLELIESQIASEMKQNSLDVDVAQPLSRTPSLRSTNISEGRVSSMENKSLSDDQQDYVSQEPTPEPNERYSSEPEPVESPVEKEVVQTYNYEAYDTNAGWGDYDVNEAWGEADAPAPPPIEVEQVDDSMLPPPPLPYSTDDVSSSSSPPPPPISEDPSTFQSTYEAETYQDQTGYTVDTSQLVGKRVRALYAYEGQNQDELSFDVDQILLVLSAADDAWITAQNDKYQVGYIPAAYVEIYGDGDLPVSPIPPHEDYATNVEPEAGLDSFDPPPPPPLDEVIDQENSSQVQYIKALYDYTATSDEEISFKEGEVFIVLEKSEDGWWLGEKGGVKGHFPSMLVIDENEEEEPSEDESPVSEGGESNDPPMPVGGPPPPTFAPPKPAYLTPNTVVIIQPTPEIESRGTFGADLEETNGNEESNNNNNDPSNGSDQPGARSESQDNPVEPEVQVKVEFDADFSLAKPNKKSNDLAEDSNPESDPPTVVNCEPDSESNGHEGVLDNEMAHDDEDLSKPNDEVTIKPIAGSQPGQENAHHQTGSAKSNGVHVDGSRDRKDDHGRGPGYESDECDLK